MYITKIQFTIFFFTLAAEFTILFSFFTSKTFLIIHIDQSEQFAQAQTESLASGHIGESRQ